MQPIPTLAERARAFFRQGSTHPLEARVERLQKLEAAILERENDVIAALKSDFQKPSYEAYSSELGLTYRDIRLSVASLSKWAGPRRALMSFALQPAHGYQRAEPLGTALIIAPWNYPFQIAMTPVAGAIAAGCNVVLKPSELTPATAKIIEEILFKAFGDDGFCTVVQGGAEVATALLNEKWDKIFFTGSTRVGQLVMQAAAKHLTPVTLELGGKSPCIVDDDVDLDTTCRRIMWGKCFNGGQTCIAPDYVLLTPAMKSRFVEGMKRAIETHYTATPRQSPDFARIINDRNFQRLQGLMAGGTVAYGGETDAATRYIAPTILTDVKLDHPLMTEEIFGPLLPVVEVENINAAIAFVQARPKPLALYVFSRNSQTADQVLEQTTSGGAVVNDVLVQYGPDGVPFGGVGQSGMGSCHGEWSFLAFSHMKSVVKKPFWLDWPFRYAPYPKSNWIWRQVLG